MKAIVIIKPGGPEVLQLQERPLPVLVDNEVLIQVAAAGINRPDVSQRKGNYPPPYWTSPDIPGLEIAGTVIETGRGVLRWKLGDRICALVTGGGYAEFCAVPEGQCLPVPENLSLVEAASLPETFFTVWSNVFERGGLGHSETLLVHGGSSGIGVAAIQLAKAWGATVYATAGSPEKCAFCEGLGATRAINYRTENFQEIIQGLTTKKGVNVILDMIGGDYTSGNIECLAEDGRLVLINYMKGEEVSIKLGRILTKRLTITGSTLRPRDTAFKTAIAQVLEKNVWPWLTEGSVRPIIYRTFPLSAAPEAHRLMEESSHIGKIVLTVTEDR